MSKKDFSLCKVKILVSRMKFYMSAIYLTKASNNMKWRLEIALCT